MRQIKLTGPRETKDGFIPDQKIQSVYSSRLALLGLVFFGICLHGFLLTNDGMFWDSWYLKSWLQDKNWRSIQEFFGSVGMPVYGWLYVPFAWFPNIVGALMFATVFCLISQAILTYFLARDLGDLTPPEAFCIALLTEACPFFSAAQDLIMFFFIFMHALFLLAAWLAGLSLAASGRKHLLLRATSFLLFFISFYNAALLVFYAGFFFLLFSKWRSSKSENLIKDAWKFTRLHFDFLFLPPLAWGFRQLVTPQFGWYADYNNPLSNFPLVLPAFRSFFSHVPGFHLSQLLEWIAAHPAATALLGFAVAAAAILSPRTQTPCRGSTRSTALLAFGSGLFFLAILPYAAAGKNYSPVPVSDQSRYAILTPLPLAILILSGFRALLLRKHASPLARWMIPLCIGISILFGIQIQNVYAAERAEWVEHRSILRNAAQSDAIRKSSIIILQNCKMTREAMYGIHAFHSVFGDTSRLATSAVPQNGQYFTPNEILMHLQRTTTLPNILNAINPAGQQILVGVQRNRKGESDWDIVKTYLKLKWSHDTAALENYLSNFTTLQFRILRTAKPLIPASQSPFKEPPSVKGLIINSLGMHMIPVAEGIWASQYETTQAQYFQLTQQNPSLFQDPLRPVERVSWHQAMDFCRRLSEMEHAAGKLPPGLVYRLPTEAEFHAFNHGKPPHDAVLAANTLYWQTQPVGSLEPNELGLYDTIGNVWEWTLDWGDRLHLEKLSSGGGFANSLFELAPHPQRFQPMDFYNRCVVKRLFGPSRPDYPDQKFWDRGFRPILAKPISPSAETKNVP